MKLNFSVWALGFGFGNLLNCIFSSDSTGVIQFFNTLCILFIVYVHVCIYVCLPPKSVVSVVTTEIRKQGNKKLTTL